MTLHQVPDSPAACPYHGIVPFRDFALADRKCFFEFFRVRAEGRFEKERIVKLVPYAAIECYKDRVPELQAGEHLLVTHDLRPGAALVSPVEEPAF